MALSDIEVPPSPGPARHRLRWVVVAVLLAAAVFLFVWPGAWVFVPVRTVHDGVTAYQVGPAANQITIGYSHGECESWRKVSVVNQTAQRVVVAVTAKTGNGACSMVAVWGHATVTLDAPLGERHLAWDDGLNLHRVSQGPIPGIGR